MIKQSAQTASAAQAVQASETTSPAATSAQAQASETTSTETTTVHAEQTLHDFVLNLLSDSQALTAFEQDPAAVLDHAGLSGISAVDVQEVIPLVMDMVPQAGALEGALNQLPLDSLDTGQLGAIQQLQFVTQALGGLPAVEVGHTTIGNGMLNGQMQIETDANGHVWAAGELHTPMGDPTAVLSGDALSGVSAMIFDSTTGMNSGPINLPGLDSIPGLAGGLPGLENLPVLDSIGGLGGLPSGFSAVSDVTDVLDSQTSSLTSLTNTTTTATTLISGATELATGAVANPTALVSAINDPAGAVTALTGTAESYAAFAAQALPSPAGEIAGQVVDTASSTTSGVVGEVTSQLQSGPLAGVTNALPTSEVTHALAPVQGVVSEVTGNLNLGGGALNGVTGSLTDPTHAVTTVTSTVSSTVSTVQDTVSHTVGSIASQSVVSDLTGSVSSATSATTTHTDSGLLGDLGHVTDVLHVPGL